MRIILTKNDFKKRIKIDGEQKSFIDFLKILSETQSEYSTLSEVVITESEIKIKTKTN